MKKKPKKREVGEFEIRVLKDGRLVMVAPDEKLIEMAEEMGRVEDERPTSNAQHSASND